MKKFNKSRIHFGNSWYRGSYHCVASLFITPFSHFDTADTNCCSFSEQSVSILAKYKIAAAQRSVVMVV